VASLNSVVYEVCFYVLWTVEGIVFPIGTDVNTLESDNVVQVLTAMLESSSLPRDIYYI